MAITLYDISVASSIQMLSAVSGFLEKGKQYCNDSGIDLADVVACKIYDDMAPFHFQIVSVVHHSLGSIKSVMAGESGPPDGYGDYDYEGLQQLGADSRKELEAMNVEDVNALEGKDVVFKLGTNAIPFSAESFVLSFSHPNLYFHAATAYDLLRGKGVPVGKRDFMGPMRIKS